MWLGPAPKSPTTPTAFTRTFRGYWDYDGGGLGDMGQHYLDPVQYFLGKDNESPVRIEADTNPQDPDAVLPWRRISLKYADGCEILLDGENKENGAAFIAGPKGKLGKDLESDIPTWKTSSAPFPNPEPQLTDFVKAVRTRQKFALNEVNGHRSCTLVNLAKIAVQTGRPLRYDSAAERFIDDEEANALHQAADASPVEDRGLTLSYGQRAAGSSLRRTNSACPIAYSTENGEEPRVNGYVALGSAEGETQTRFRLITLRLGVGSLHEQGLHP